eukprot:scaffold41100_cov57-Cyclotella_meneghiniana.AAC.3
MTLATKDHVCEDTNGDKEVQRTALVHNRTIPSWVKEQMHLWGERFCFPEWDDDEDANDDCDLENYRFDYGWKGKDLCHSKTSPVRISHYAIQYTDTGVGTTLTGITHFTSHAESHAGYCHGGSMTCNCLKKPIAVGSILKIVGKIVKCDRRKVWVDACLVAVAEDDESEIEHCTAEGLVILKKEC